MGASSTQSSASAKERVDVPRLRAQEFVRPMRGGSQPWLVRCEDGGHYVIKFRENPQHVRVLANEMLGGLLARLIQLPVADFAFVEVPPALAEQLRSGAPGGSETLALERLDPGPHFGSRFPGDPAETLAVEFLPDHLLRQVRNLREAFLGALAFDKWTCNCDGRQLVFHRQPGARRQGYTACLIDQGFCFNDGDWSFPDSVLRGLHPRRLVYEGVRGAESFEPFLSRIENLGASELEACARRIPPGWCDGESAGPIRLAESLYARRRKLRQALIDLKNSEFNPFPNWK
ncbi:MAG TPA: HipA family kinase [Terriglobia bacterium]|nr:HipA family kinase [Terriglobia bacterium]